MLRKYLMISRIAIYKISLKRVENPYICKVCVGDVAQLARVLDWQSRGRGFESHLLHQK